MQGPPGTGKSHTIADLAAHYVAHGKSVLVTAQKEQALTVLIDKAPPEIRDLCVPVLGPDAAARGRLQSTVVEIAAPAQRRPGTVGIARLEAELDLLDEQYAATTNQLRAQRAAETHARRTAQSRSQRRSGHCRRRQSASATGGVWPASPTPSIRACQHR